MAGRVICDSVLSATASTGAFGRVVRTQVCHDFGDGQSVGMSTTGGIFRGSTATTSRLRVRLRSGFGFSFRVRFGNNRGHNLWHLFADSFVISGHLDVLVLVGTLY